MFDQEANDQLNTLNSSRSAHIERRFFGFGEIDVGLMRRLQPGIPCHVLRRRAEINRSLEVESIRSVSECTSSGMAYVDRRLCLGQIEVRIKVHVGVEICRWSIGVVGLVDITTGVTNP